MIKTIELRNKPELKIILSKDKFEIIDASEPQNNGIYSLEKFKSAELNAARTNWLISSLSIVVDLFTGSAIGGKFSNKANLNLEMENQNLKVWLIDADFEKAKRVAEILNSEKAKV